MGWDIYGGTHVKKLLLNPDNREALERSELVQQDASSSGEKRLNLNSGFHLRLG
jgi:hypothetical protein